MCQSVSYTHLDVYKRQEDSEEWEEVSGGPGEMCIRDRFRIGQVSAALENPGVYSKEGQYFSFSDSC